MKSPLTRKAISFVFSIIFLLSFVCLSGAQQNNYEAEAIGIEELVTEESKEIVVVEKEVYIEIEPENYYEVSSEEREMIARLVYREGGGTSLECQKMIASVIFNRWTSSEEDVTLHDIVYADGQFTPASVLYKTTPVEENYEAVDYVIKNGSILPEYVKYFRASYDFSWDGYHNYTSVDGVFFGYFDKDI